MEQAETAVAAPEKMIWHRTILLTEANRAARTFAITAARESLRIARAETNPRLDGLDSAETTLTVPAE